MIKILVKALILVCIILSIYFIVNPSACSNLINGHVVNSPEQAPVVVPSERQHSELFTPTGDVPLQAAPQTQQPAEEKPAPAATAEQPAVQEPAQPQQTQPAAQQAPAAQLPAVTDTHSLQDQSAQAAQKAAEESVYTQAQVDYAIASRYVELENEYIKQKKDMKKAAQEISYIVMDDFEMTPSEWEAFLQRATVDNLFDKVRQAQAAKN